MELIMPTGKKTEKKGTLMKDISQSEKKMDSGTLEQIDKKDGLLSETEK